MERINSILDKIEAKQKEIESIEHEIKHVLARELNNLCKEEIFSKFKEGQFITHKEKYVFKLGDTNSISDCHVNIDSYADIEYKSFHGHYSKNVPICRAVSLIENARLSTDEEIRDYYICQKMAQCKVLGI